jgi:hypothetical protein
MGILSTNRAQLTSGGLISASFVSDVYDVLTGATAETIVVSGSSTNHGLSISGSLNVSSAISASYITGSITGNITGNLTGTSSFATLSSTASYVSGSDVDGIVSSATTATTATSASFATTAITASYVANTLTFNTGSSLPSAVNGQLAVSSSGDLYFASASAWYKVTLG